ncbi:MAG: methyltransferase domain-containing protein [Verrucomicrobia bacterium]|nr:methyltransferase domain-containing protein [Verrucomicrobiota bacterium]
MTEDKSHLVDDIITAVPGEWRFDKKVAQSFDTHVRKSVPFYDEIQHLIVDMSEFFVRDNSSIFDIGASTGETLYHLANKHRQKKNIRLVGIEQSIRMVEEAGTKLKDFPNIRLLHQNVQEFARFDQADLVLALYTLQFLNLEDRYDLLAKIFRDLRVGGAFLLVEKVHAESAQAEDMWNELHWDFKSRSGLSDEMILAKSRSLRGVLSPMTVTENIRMLEWAGFKRTDVFFKWLNWIGIVAIKTEPGNPLNSEDESLPEMSK